MIKVKRRGILVLILGFGIFESLYKKLSLIYCIRVHDAIRFEVLNVGVDENIEVSILWKCEYKYR